MARLYLAAALAALVALWAGVSQAAYIGIPTPTFGLTETLPAEPSEWPSAANGNWFYTNNGVSCTDTSNPNGYPNNPRCTIPAGPFTSGQYVILGVEHVQTGGNLTRRFDCSAGAPCFFRSRTFTQGSSSTMAQIRLDTDTTFTFYGNPAYLIVEGIYWGAGLTNGTVTFACTAGTPPTFISFRYNIMLGPGNSAAGADAATSMAGCSTSLVATDIVLYKNTISSYGDSDPAAAENDFHGIKPASNVTRTFVLENTISDMGGDSIQVADASTAAGTYPTHTFIGKNTFHSNKENAVDIKRAVDVIVSENIFHTMRPSGGGSFSAGECVVAHNLPGGTSGWTWIIANEIYDCNNGIVFSGNTDGYIIANKIYNIHQFGASDTCSSDGTGAAIVVRGGLTITAINNTIRDVGCGADFASGSNFLKASNNIITDFASGLWSIKLGGTSNQSGSDLQYSLLRQTATSGTAQIIWGDGTSRSVASFQAAFPSEGTGLITPESNPVYVSATDHCLQGTSPGVNAGESDPFGVHAAFQTRYGRAMLPTTNTPAFDQTARPVGAAWDLGACEFSSGSAPAAPSGLRVLQ